MRARVLSTGILAAAILAAIPAFAHHAVADDYDVSKTVRISGTISNVVFSNPHITFSLDVKNSDGTVTRWKVETASPNNLIRKGITKAQLAGSTTLTVDAYIAKDGSPKANGRTLTLTLADGRELTVLAYPGQNSCTGPNCIKCENCDGIGY